MVGAQSTHEWGARTEDVGHDTAYLPRYKLRNNSQRHRHSAQRRCCLSPCLPVLVCSITRFTSLSCASNTAHDTVFARVFPSLQEIGFLWPLVQGSPTTCAEPSLLPTVGLGQGYRTAIAFHVHCAPLLHMSRAVVRTFRKVAW